ncbi:MAG: FAD-dependent oxidoreductase [Clostridia bacterium]|nr:FAD-dependent oxidoreductase [Clostridia bacterium]
MKKEYDVAVIGMGPSGVFLAYELIQLKKAKNVILIDQGKRVENRNCPIEKTGKCLKCKPNCNITSGFSGAGAFSDGKLLSYHLSLYNEKEENIYLGGNGGSYIKKYMSYQEIKDLLSYTDDVYLKFGADAKLEGMENKDEIKELQAKAKKEDLNLIDIPIRHLGTEKAHELYKKIEDYIEKEVELKFETTVKDIIIEDGKAKGIIIQSANDKEAPEEEIYAKHIVSAVGRKGAKWLDQMCKKHKIKSELGNVDIGIRYELPDKVMEKVNKYMYEGKVIARPEPFKDKVRTFCQNPSGFVAAEVYDNGLSLVNGHSYKDKKSQNTNLAILVSHHFEYPFKKPIEYGINIANNLNELGNGNIVVQRLGDIYRGKRTWPEELKNNSVEATLKTAVPGDITFALGYRTMTNILEFIRKMDKVVEGFAHPDNLLYGPEIKFYSNELVVDKNFQTSIENLYSIGDGGGLTTGLMMASCSGVQMARILNKMI